MNSNSRTQTVPPDRGQPRPTAPPGPLPLDINLEQFDGSPASSPRQGETPKQFQKKGSFWQQWSPLKGSGANNTSNNNMNADSPERNPNSPTESAEGGERVVQQGSNKEVTFKKAKKLTRAASNHYMKPLHDLTQANKFANWNRAELIELIIYTHHIELRSEDRMTLISLRDFCENLYTGKPAPPKPKLPGLFEIVLMNVMARRLQNKYIIYKFNKRQAMEEEEQRVYTRRARAFNNSATENDEISTAELLYMTNNQPEMVGGRVADLRDAAISNLPDNMDESVRGSSMEHSLNIGTEGDDGTVTASQAPKKKKKKTINILDLPWTPPEIEKARRYADYVQPRRGGKGGEKFEFMNTTTGRHCFLGGCGEQFDLWQEGQISEFSIFGPGVTNYFKFMKWGFWLFVVLTILALPAMVLNMNGDNNSNSGLKAIAQTTIGNLASTAANSSVHVRIPGCDTYGLYDMSCTFNGESLAMFYSSLDIAISGIILIGFIWLTFFEKLEQKELDESTVSNLPEDVTEEQLIAHFNHLAEVRETVVAVSIAYDNAEEIEECKKRGDLIRAKVHLVHEHRHKCTQLRKDKTEAEYTEMLEKERTKFFAKMKDLNADLKKKEEKLEELSKKNPKPVYAFITFNKVADRDKVLDKYTKMTLYTWWCSNTHLRLKGKFLRVRHAPEPSVIIWENLGHTHSDRYRRRVLTTFGSLLLVFISLVMIFSSKYLEETAGNNGSSQSELCPEDFTSWDKETQQQYVDDNSQQLYCYCDQFNTLQQASDNYCQKYLQKNISAQVLLYFASFIVLVVNNLIVKAMRVSSAYEKHHTGDGQRMSIFLRLFILKYINTAAVFFINNNNVIMRNIFGVELESTTEFTADWFNTIGVTIVLVQLGDIFNAHSDHIMKYIMFKWKKYKVSKDPSQALTQDDLNKMFVGPEFEFAFNYAQMMSTFFVCLTFSTGIPLLYPIAAANFILFYLVEKYLFIHCYKMPPQFNTLVGKRATALIPIGLLIHVVMSVWVLSNNSLFVSDINQQAIDVSPGLFGNTVRDKITREATLPLFILFCIIIVLRFGMIFFNKVSRLCAKMYHLVCGCCIKKKNKDHPPPKMAAHSVVTYTRAVQRNLIKGLATYNVLQNPSYKEAFGITWKFAVTHKDVRQVRTIKNKADAGSDEYDPDKIDQIQRTGAPLSPDANPNDKRRSLNRVQSSRNRSFYNSVTNNNVANDDPCANDAAIAASLAAREVAANQPRGGDRDRHGSSAPQPEASNRSARPHSVTRDPRRSPSPAMAPADVEVPSGFIGRPTPSPAPDAGTSAHYAPVAQYPTGYGHHGSDRPVSTGSGHRSGRTPSPSEGSGHHGQGSVQSSRSGHHGGSNPGSGQYSGGHRSRGSSPANVGYSNHSGHGGYAQVPVAEPYHPQPHYGGSQGGHGQPQRANHVTRGGGRSTPTNGDYQMVQRDDHDPRRL